MKKPIQVRVLNQYIRRELTTDPILKNLLVIGEVSNLRINRFTYFDLKDGDSFISCVYFANDLNIDNGQQVIVNGNVQIYEAQSKYQIKVIQIQTEGQGDSAKKLEALKKKLYNKGYFDDFRKKEIPKLVTKIGLITSDKSAAIVDFLHILEQNYPIAKIYLAAVRVQGSGGIEDIVKAIEYLDELDLDCLVLTRGGGSNEDLALFNEEAIADAIFHAQTPFIAAIGHEIDITIAELVSDLRMATPTKAAQFIAGNFSELLLHIDQLNQTTKDQIESKLNVLETKIEMLNLRIQKQQPLHLIERQIAKLLQINLANQHKINAHIQNKLRLVEQMSSRNDSILQESLLKYTLQIKNPDREYVDVRKLEVGGIYIMENKDISYKIQIKEKL